jgi:azurin
LELAAGERLIEITGDDTMKFNVTEIRAAGREAGRLAQEHREHPCPRWRTLGIAESDERCRCGALCAAAATKPPEYLPADTSTVLAHTKMVGSGESDHVKVTVPTEPGAYPYVCTFPGHFMLMKGKLIVN